MQSQTLIMAPLYLPVPNEALKVSEEIAKRLTALRGGVLLSGVGFFVEQLTHFTIHIIHSFVLLRQLVHFLVSMAMETV